MYTSFGKVVIALHFYWRSKKELDYIYFMFYVNVIRKIILFINEVYILIVNWL